MDFTDLAYLEGNPGLADLEGNPNQADLEDIPDSDDLEDIPDSANLEDIPDLADLEVSYMELGDVDYIQGLVSKHFSFDDVACFDFAITTIAIAAVG